MAGLAGPPAGSRRLTRYAARMSRTVLLAAALAVSGCTTIVVVPPQPADAGPEPDAPPASCDRCAAGQLCCPQSSGVSRCVDVQSDPANCGGCGEVCPSGQVCRVAWCYPPG